MENTSKHVVVTGASRGIGFELALQLAQQGHRVTAIARSEKALSQLKSAFPEHINTAVVDLSDSAQVSNLDVSLFGPVDGIVQNAGLLVNRPFLELTDADWQQMWDVNVMGSVRLTRALLPRMNRGSHVVLISSMGGFQGSSKYPGLSGYATTKGAVSVLAETLSVELSSFGIACNALCLGAVQTEMLAEAFPGYNAPVKPEQMASFISNFLLTQHYFYNGKILPVALSNP